VYVVGTISFQNGSATYGNNANIVSDSTITIDGAADVRTGTSWPLIASTNGNVNLNNSGVLRGIVYAPNGTFTASGSALLEGAALAKSVSIQNSGVISYPVALRSDAKYGGSAGSTALSSYDIQ
jgi:hypothetical protein